MSRQRCAPPTCSAARATAASRACATAPAAPPSRPQAGRVPENSIRACLRVWSMVASAVRVRPARRLDGEQAHALARAAATRIRVAVLPSITNILCPSSSSPHPCRGGQADGVEVHRRCPRSGQRGDGLRRRCRQESSWLLAPHEKRVGGETANGSEIGGDSKGAAHLLEDHVSSRANPTRIFGGWRWPEPSARQ